MWGAFNAHNHKITHHKITFPFTCFTISLKTDLMMNFCFIWLMKLLKSYDCAGCGQQAGLAGCRQLCGGCKRARVAKRSMWRFYLTQDFKLHGCKIHNVTGRELTQFISVVRAKCNSTFISIDTVYQPGVYILSLNSKIAPNCALCVLKIFIFVLICRMHAQWFIF